MHKKQCLKLLIMTKMDNNMYRIEKMCYYIEKDVKEHYEKQS